LRKADFPCAGANNVFVSARKLYAWVAAAGILSVAFATALAAHAALYVAQSAPLLGGDYHRHAHGAVFPVGFAGLTAALGAILMYGIHLASLDSRSLPSLARAFRARIGWQTIFLTALAASLVLVGMETAEQFVAGQFDGVSSAFSGVPEIGLALLVLFSAIGNALLRALCDCLAQSHARIVLAVAFLLCSRNAHSVLPSRVSKRKLLTTFRYACDAPQAYGKRGPPLAS
jgi:hypothetical protein